MSIGKYKMKISRKVIRLLIESAINEKYEYHIGEDDWKYYLEATGLIDALRESQRDYITVANDHFDLDSKIDSASSGGNDSSIADMYTMSAMTSGHPQSRLKSLSQKKERLLESFYEALRALDDIGGEIGPGYNWQKNVPGMDDSFHFIMKDFRNSGSVVSGDSKETKNAERTLDLLERHVQQQLVPVDE